VANAQGDGLPAGGDPEAGASVAQATIAMAGASALKVSPDHALFLSPILRDLLTAAALLPTAPTEESGWGADPYDGSRGSVA
jgi:hypothetical protein